jgi:hypothetical protein
MPKPNKSPEPTRIVAFSDSLRFQLCHIAGSGWLSFLRSASRLSGSTKMNDPIKLVLAGYDTETIYDQHFSR